MTLLIGLGFIINLKKSVLNPTTTGVPVIHFEFADDNITPARQAVLAKEAVGEVQELGKDNGTGTIPSVMNDGGSASDDSTSSTVLPTPGSREDQVTPNGELVQLRDIRINIWDGRRIDMVVFQVSQFNSRPLKVEKWDLTILSDASKIGWGATCRGKNTGGPWTTEEAIFHINYLELLAAFFALKSFASQVENASILLRLDNVTAIAFINKMGATHSQDLSDLAVEMVYRLEDLYSCQTPPRQGERARRLGIPTCARLERLEIEPPDFSGTRMPARTILHRPLCVEDQYATRVLLQLETRSVHSSCGRSVNSLDKPLPLPVPPVCTDHMMPRQDQGRTDIGSSHSTSVAE